MTEKFPKTFPTDIDGDEVDLDSTEVVSGGERLTTERAEQINADVLADPRRANLVPGGKSLSGNGKTSPTVQFRVPESLREKLEERAKAEGVTPTNIARKALVEYLQA